MTAETVQPYATDGVRELRSLWSLDSGDPWGEVMAHAVVAAELLYVLGEEIPEAWQFRPAPVLDTVSVEDYADRTDTWPDREIAEMVRDGVIRRADLRYWGNVSHRRAVMLRAAGLNY